MALLTIEEARSWAKDYESSDEEMERLISFAEEYVAAAIGTAYDPASHRVKQLAGMYVAEADDHRGITQAEAGSMRYLTRSLLTQLRTECSGVSNLDTVGRS